MSKRTKGREIALQILYQIDISGNSFCNIWEMLGEEKHSDEIEKFSRQLTKGSLENLKLIDKTIENCTENWRLSRIAVVERNILRSATYEILFCPEIPVLVSINEAVNLAKKYSSLEAGKFVNAILDKIKNVHKVTN